MTARTKRRRVQVYLVPGFFGFTELGELNYFYRVSGLLGDALSARGVDADVIEAQTVPAGSIRRRAKKLLSFVEQNGGTRAEAIHFVGHSTGGLDVRMLLTPGVRLDDRAAESAVARRTKTATSLSTPHYGTPLATFFTSLNGRNLLYLLTVLATSAPGRYGLYLAAKLIGIVARLDELALQDGNILDSVAKRLLSKITPDRGDDLWEFVRQIGSDQGAMVQLTPEAMDLFNAAAIDRDSVEYVSFVSASPAPDVKKMIATPKDLYRPFTHAVYAAAWALASREHSQYPYPAPPPAVRDRLERLLGLSVDARANDGVVPALSQVYGRLGGACNADHLDVVGQFRHVEVEGDTYATWLYSGSTFDDQKFAALWGGVADVIAGVGTNRRGCA